MISIIASSILCPCFLVFITFSPLRMQMSFPNNNKFIIFCNRGIHTTDVRYKAISMMEQGYMVLGTPKNIITLDADNSIIQLTTFELSYMITFSRKSLMSCTSVIYFACIDYSNAKLFYSMLRRIWTSQIYS